MDTTIGNKTETIEQRTITSNDVKAYNKAVAEKTRLEKFIKSMNADLIREVHLFGTVDDKNPNKMTLVVGKTIVTVTHVENVRFSESAFKADNPETWEDYKMPNPYDKVTTNV